MKLALIICLALVAVSTAKRGSKKDGGSKDSGEVDKISLEKHNEYRGKHQSPEMTNAKDLKKAAAKCAKYYAKKGVIDHSCPSKPKDVGENLYTASGSDGPPPKSQAAGDAADSWYDEIKQYNFGNPGFSASTGHFTQMVWKESTELGTGVAKSGNQIFVCALYRPAGNVQGGDHFKENVLEG